MLYIFDPNVVLESDNLSTCPEQVLYLLGNTLVQVCFILTWRLVHK